MKEARFSWPGRENCPAEQWGRKPPPSPFRVDSVRATVSPAVELKLTHI